MTIQIIHNMVDPEDAHGRTYKEVNMEKTHSHPIGSLVELKDGVRLWVVYHSRDCDGTPLYELSADKDDTIKESPSFRNRSWTGGYSERSLTLVK